MARHGARHSLTVNPEHLGTGKTSLLNRLLNDREKCRAEAIVSGMT
ncbi:MAG: hypothetical protein OXC26_15375 [Albidovulum sp.]|nr:hypothetical protein [Albidovulum sp.]